MAKHVCVLRIEGTNCEQETKEAFELVGAEAELVHLKQLTLSEDVDRTLWRKLDDYDVLALPGGFSAGDSVRAGAILAARMKSKLSGDLVRFVEAGKGVIGICNGFQILVELGLLPAFNGPMSEHPEAVLVSNEVAHFVCRPADLAVTSNTCKWTTRLPKDRPVVFPVAHAEGRFVLPPGREEELLERLLERDQVAFRYVKPDGAFAEEEYPFSPNGALYDIAGITNPEGNVLGLMPHPERVVSPYTMPDWTREERQGDGLGIFASLADW